MELYHRTGKNVEPTMILQDRNRMPSPRKMRESNPRSAAILPGRKSRWSLRGCVRQYQVAALACFVALLSVPALGEYKDILIHRDGTRVEGTITEETATKIVIQTEKFGQLHFQKRDLVTIDRGRDREAREAAAAKVTPTPYNYAVFIPEGPVNALSPPVQIPVIAGLILRGVTPPASPSPASVSADTATTPAEELPPTQQVPAATPMASASPLPPPTASPASASASAEAGAVTASRGIAQLSRAGKAVSLKVGTPLAVGDTIETGLDSAVVLRLLTGHKIALGPRTMVRISKVSLSGGCVLRLESGVVWCDAPAELPAPAKLFTLETPDCILTPEPTDLASGATVKVALLEDGTLFVGSLKGKMIFYHAGTEFKTIPSNMPIVFDRTRTQMTEMPNLLPQLQTEWQQVRE
ncbi:MAG: hypothetical protein D6691_04600 [Candidatus Hydrogenedentota bacterium]|nr:MAG: hypothetical protein D6691_04600 [Candidatus Hydrogenedentota bacterium]